jgi:membrane-bound lytic murein transglycosylase B
VEQFSIGEKRIQRNDAETARRKGRKEQLLFERISQTYGVPAVKISDKDSVMEQ